MGRKPLAIAILTVGVLTFLVALTADPVGIGDSPGLGWAQLSLAAVGVVIAALGMVRLRGG